MEDDNNSPTKTQEEVRSGISSLKVDSDNNKNILNKISKPLFDSIVNEMDFKTFFRFGSSVCKHLRSLFFFSNRWRIMDLSFMNDNTQDKVIYRLCGTLNQYFNNNDFNFIDRKSENNDDNEKQEEEEEDCGVENNQLEGMIFNKDNNKNSDKNDIIRIKKGNKKTRIFHSFYIETLVLDTLYKITSNVFKYINNCVAMSNIENLSINDCLGIKFFNGFFEIPHQRKIVSLSLPAFSSSEPSNYFKKLGSLTSLNLPGTVESIQLYKYLESCPLLTKLVLSYRSKDSLFNPSLLEKLYKCKQITHLTLVNMIIRNDIFISLFMSLTNLQVIKIYNSFQITGGAINTALESMPQLRELSIDFCRNVGNINVHSDTLKVFHSSYTLTCPEISFPNLNNLSIIDWSITKENYFTIFSKFKGQLKFLSMSKTKIDDEILESVLSLIGCGLETLDLGFNQITDKSIDVILNHCKTLCKVYLNNTLITKEKADELYKLKNLYVLKTSNTF
ncbi:hypothetical protein RB653_003029 [Dictyostelium firmibasis]|uniref:F-box domain-containing protein n=1 Tax=Dictyostelium firmibasis TaxID=79012 RepID=A0AAN7YT86_9MYCE